LKRHAKFIDLSIFVISIIPNMTSNESATVTLKGPDDWDAWDKQFKAEATRRSLLEHIEAQNPFVLSQRYQILEISN
jgi:hypothetical protein